MASPERAEPSPNTIVARQREWRDRADAAPTRDQQEQGGDGRRPREAHEEPDGVGQGIDRHDPAPALDERGQQRDRGRAGPEVRDGEAHASPAAEHEEGDQGRDERPRVDPPPREGPHRGDPGRVGADLEGGHDQRVRGGGDPVHQDQPAPEPVCSRRGWTGGGPPLRRSRTPRRPGGPGWPARGPRAAGRGLGRRRRRSSHSAAAGSSGCAPCGETSAAPPRRAGRRRRRRWRRSRRACRRRGCPCPPPVLYCPRRRKPRVTSERARPRFLSTRLGRASAFAGIVWAVAGSFIALEIAARRGARRPPGPPGPGPVLRPVPDHSRVAHVRRAGRRARGRPGPGAEPGRGPVQHLADGPQGRAGRAGAAVRLGGSRRAGRGPPGDPDDRPRPRRPAARACSRRIAAPRRTPSSWPSWRTTRAARRATSPPATRPARATCTSWARCGATPPLVRPALPGRAGDLRRRDPPPRARGGAAASPLDAHDRAHSARGAGVSDRRGVDGPHPARHRRPAARAVGSRPGQRRPRSRALDRFQTPRRSIRGA